VAPRASERLVTSLGNDSTGSSESGQRIDLPDQDGLLRLYYQGGRLPSPSGGLLMVLGVHPELEGSGSVLLECTTSSLQYRMSVPKATRAERKKVRDLIDEGGDPKCPRHEGQRLTRTRHDFACPKCGVRYAKAK